MQRSILLNSDYMKWLEDYISENGEIATTYIAEDNKEKYYFSHLTTLYILIDVYAKIKNITPIIDEYGNHYCLEYNDNIYTIGYECEYTNNVYAFSSYESTLSTIINWNDVFQYYDCNHNRLPFDNTEDFFNNYANTINNQHYLLRTKKDAK